MILFVTVALADPGNVATLDPPWSLLTSSSPGVALAIALAYGAWRLSAVATRATVLLEGVARGGIPVRVELAPADRALIERAVEAAEDSGRSGTRQAPRALRDAGTVVR